MTSHLIRFSESQDVTNFIYELAYEQEIYCTNDAGYRLGEITGFIQALAFGGHEEAAEKMADSLFAVFNRLTAAQSEHTFTTPIEFSMPTLKHILHTSGIHSPLSFGFQRLVLDRTPNPTYTDSPDICREIQNVATGLSCKPGRFDAVYKYNIVGGIIFNEPRDIRDILESKDNLWTIHS